MTNHVCKNERCKYHLEIHDKDAQVPYIHTIEDGKQVRVERHLYRSYDGQREFYLCDVCHAAVELTLTPNVERNRPVGGFLPEGPVEGSAWPRAENAK